MKLSVPMPPSGRFQVQPGVIATALAILILDQATKSWITLTLGQPGRPNTLQILGDWVRLSFTTNSGAAFGMFPAGTLFFTVVALIAAPILLVARGYVRERAWWMTVVFGMLLGGTLGNLLDRLRQGRVVDFIDVGIGDVRWWSFNVADSSFVVGVIILAIYLSLTPDEPARSSDDRASVA
jgi:signal peptidase II